MSRASGKREFVRLNNQFNVRIVTREETARPGYREITTSRSINISASGMLINAVDRLAVGTIVRVTFMKPNSFEFFKGSGKVVRVDDNENGTCRMAIYFFDLSPDDKQMLDYYITLGAN